MTPDKKAKIARFINDRLMAETIYDIFLQSFLKTKDRDVHNLAASMIAIEHLNEAWKELEKLKNEQDSEEKGRKQIGL